MGTPPDIPVIDPAQAALERKRELDIKEREVAAKEREVLAKEEELKRSRWINPTVIGLFAAGIGLAGSIIVAGVNNRNTLRVTETNNNANQRLEQFRAQSSLIIEAIRTGTGKTAAACNNLTFFVSLGLIQDTEGKIANQCKNVPKAPPSLPPASGGANTSPFVPFGQVSMGIRVRDEFGKPIPGATIETHPVIEPHAGDVGDDGDGDSFVIEPPGTYTIRVSKPGYKTVIRQVTFLPQTKMPTLTIVLLKAN